MAAPESISVLSLNAKIYTQMLLWINWLLLKGSGGFDQTDDGQPAFDTNYENVQMSHKLNNQNNY